MQKIKVLHFSVTEPHAVTKGHMSWKSTFLWPMGWSFKTGSTISKYLQDYYQQICTYNDYYQQIVLTMTTISKYVLNNDYYQQICTYNDYYQQICTYNDYYQQIYVYLQRLQSSQAVGACCRTNSQTRDPNPCWAQQCHTSCIDKNWELPIRIPLVLTEDKLIMPGNIHLLEV